jgi:LmeA-like phospholipid-binding
MRAIRWLVITLIVLAGLYVAADFVLKGVAENAVARSLQSSLELSKQPDVDLGGFPFLIRAIDGHLDSVDLRGTNLAAGGQPLRSVALHLADVRFSATALISGRSTSVRFHSSSGTAELSGKDLTDALTNAGVNARIRLSNGQAHASIPGVPAEVAVEVSLRGQSLVFRPDVPFLVPVSLSVDLSGLVPDVRYRSAAIRGSLAVVTFTLAIDHFDI